MLALVLLGQAVLRPLVPRAFRENLLFSDTLVTYVNNLKGSVQIYNLKEQSAVSLLVVTSRMCKIFIMFPCVEGIQQKWVDKAICVFKNFFLYIRLIFLKSIPVPWNSCFRLARHWIVFANICQASDLLHPTMRVWKTGDFQEVRSGFVGLMYWMTPHGLQPCCWGELNLSSGPALPLRNSGSPSKQEFEPRIPRSRERILFLVLSEGCFLSVVLGTLSPTIPCWSHFI